MMNCNVLSEGSGKNLGFFSKRPFPYFQESFQVFFFMYNRFKGNLYLPQVNKLMSFNESSGLYATSSEGFSRLLSQYRGKVYEKNASMMVDTQVHKGKPQILVVEDNIDEWFLIRWTLVQQYRQAEFNWLAEADHVLSYLETLSRQEKEFPKFILLDLYLPSATEGIRTLQALKSHRVFRQIPVVVLSRSHDPGDISEALKYSGDSYLIKPLSYSEWIDCFQELTKYWQEPLSA
jgi:CheY-like chemotaxis protein